MSLKTKRYRPVYHRIPIVNPLNESLHQPVSSVELVAQLEYHLGGGGLMTHVHCTGGSLLRPIAAAGFNVFSPFC